MQITECRIKLEYGDAGATERLLAYASITFDGAFCVRDLKIIDGEQGVFIAMPSRKPTDRCGRCAAKNYLRSRFCSDCGHRLGDDRETHHEDGSRKRHADIVHPINLEMREQITRAVLDAYFAEMHAKPVRRREARAIHAA